MDSLYNLNVLQTLLCGLITSSRTAFQSVSAGLYLDQGGMSIITRNLRGTRRTWLDSVHLVVSFWEMLTTCVTF